MKGYHLYIIVRVTYVKELIVYCTISKTNVKEKKRNGNEVIIITINLQKIKKHLCEKKKR